MSADFLLRCRQFLEELESLNRELDHGATYSEWQVIDYGGRSFMVRTNPGLTPDQFMAATAGRYSEIRAGGCVFLSREPR